MAFICFADLMVVSLWTVTIRLAIKSGKGILSLFSTRPKQEWLSIPDTIAQYGDDHPFSVD
jgi:hypothetical protein